MLKALWAHPHTKQFVAMVAVASTGLVAGSFVSVKADQSSLIMPSQSPSPQISFSPAAVVLGQPQSISVASLISPSPSSKAVAAPVAVKAAVAPAPVVAPAAAVKRAFSWGVTIAPFPFKDKNDVFLPEQFRLAKELGLNMVRVDYVPDNPTANQQAIDLARQNNLKLVMIIPFGPKDIFSDSTLSDDAYHYVYDIVSQHKGQVEVWQLANEVASVAIIDGGHYGVDRVDYPEAKYQAVATWLKAASKATHDADPAARRLINDQWVHVGFFDRFIAEGGDFDILGWNWFSDMGTDWSSPVINTATKQHYALMTKLKSFHKDIWITEVNRRGGSSGGNEKDEADFIQIMAEKAYAEPAVKAFLPYLLVEDQGAPDKEKGYGMVNVDLTTQWTVGPKQAFSRYQALIKAK